MPPRRAIVARRAFAGASHQSIPAEVLGSDGHKFASRRRARNFARESLCARFTCEEPIFLTPSIGVPCLHPRRRLAVAAGVLRRSLFVSLLPWARFSSSSPPPLRPVAVFLRPPTPPPSEISLLILGCSIKSGPALSPPSSTLPLPCLCATLSSSPFFSRCFRFLEPRLSALSGRRRCAFHASREHGSLSLDERLL